MTTEVQSGPGRVLDARSGLRSWNGHWVFLGHMGREDAVSRILKTFPEAESRADLGTAFHEWVHEVELGGSRGWVFCSRGAADAVPVTCLVPQPRLASEPAGQESPS